MLFDTSTTLSQSLAAYVDGVAQSVSYYSNSIMASFYFRDFNLTYMHHDGPSLQGDGRLQNVKIYNRLLSAVEIRQLHENPWQFLKPYDHRLLSSQITTNVQLTFNGFGGTVTAASIPVEGAIIRLYIEATGELVSETSTDEDGVYVFGSKDAPVAGGTYTIIAYDALTGYQYNGGILRGMTPGAMS